ncbi:hypothetical protein CGX12_16585 [Zobellella denitrificans]|uniref:baseplate J/gp47 family protein n=1 Tax=Zobellella denitrificans TaxID=347534 RepID=UPI000B8C5E2B|nr:baseplate J/gp47 family protein [Zobellella denitrificans]OXS13997.1 hypothetical protein CGX12_16585 [Zobellella denitrificans]
MSARPQVDFQRLVDAAGIPTTDEALAIELAREVEAAGSLITNDNRMSPFWRLQKALVIKPALWLLRGLIVGHVLPNSFAATARGYYQDLKAWDVDLTRKPATSTRGQVRFVKQSPADAVTVPAGTLVSTERINGVIYSLATVQAVTLPAGQPEGLIVCEASAPGSAWNLPAGYYCILPKAVPGIVSVNNPVDWITQPGAEQEDDDALGLRIQNQFSVVGRYHIDAVYRSLLASVAGIRADHIFFEHDAPRGPGTANAFILMEVGETSASLIAQLNHHVMAQGNHGHGDDLQVAAMPETRHELSLTLYPAPNLTEAELAGLQQQADAVVRAAFRETAAYPQVTRTWPNGRFSISLLTTQLHQILGESVESLEIHYQDIISGLSIPRLDTVTVAIHE